MENRPNASLPRPAPAQAASVPTAPVLPCPDVVKALVDRAQLARQVT